MLRQALDAAAKGQQQTQQGDDQQVATPSETDALLQQPAQDINYSSTQAGQSGDDDSDMRLSSDGEDDDAYSLDGWHEDEGSEVEPTPTFLGKAWTKLKSCFFLVLNVENLWDSPSENSDPEVSRRNHLIVFLWFFILAASYALERSTFKLLVDRSGPFRLFAVEMVTFTHALMIGIGMFLSALTRKDFSFQPLGIPVVDVGLMALLDTVHMLLVFLTGYHVPPTLTVILVQFTIPLTALITQFVHADGCVKRCCGSPSGSDSQAETSLPSVEGTPLPGWGGLSMEHISGSIIISLAVLLALSPALYTIWDPNFFIYADTIPIQTAYNTMLFVSSCIPAAASQLYKEHIFLQYKQPVQSDLLNLILSIFQLVFASIMSPLVYTLLGLAATRDWPKLYPSSGFSQNFMEGFQCFLGTLDEDRAESGYEDEAVCKFSLSLVFLHAFSIISIGVAVDKIVNAGATKVLFRGISAGIIVSVVSLYIYDLKIPDFSYGPAIDSLNLVCVLLLVVGSEVYHRVSLQDATFETVYPEVENFYDEDL
mmetsp:Transcript_55021/g.159286  ORF Transcript_55021/g.159286 Transcript_55021/m.159286 type:complete len:539 (+) Transcript_55021:262-1878(+)